MISKSYFKSEWKRIIKSPLNWLIVFVSFILYMISAYEDLTIAPEMCPTRIGENEEIIAIALPNMVSTIASSLSWTYLTFILPLVICFPYALSYSMERNCGYSNLLRMKISKKTIMNTKFILNFICSGLVGVVPFILMEIVVIIKQGIYLPNDPLFDMFAIGFHKDYAMNHPVLYCVNLTLNVFICSAVIGTIGLGVANLIRKTVNAYIVTFCIYLFSSMVLGIISDVFSFVSNYHLGTRTVESAISLFIFYGVCFLLGSLLYWFGERWGSDGSEY